MSHNEAQTLVSRGVKDPEERERLLLSTCLR